jgi:hypothetical protein
MNHCTTFTEDFLVNPQKRKDLQELFNNEKYPKFDTSTGEITGYYLHDAVRNISNFSAKKALSETSRFTKFKNKTENLYSYVLNFKDINPKRAKLENLYDKRKYNALIGILDKIIQGSYIATLEYGVQTGIHAHILCEKQNSTNLKSEFKVTEESYAKTIQYLKKGILSPVKKGEYRTNYLELKSDYEVIAGRIIELRKMKRKRSAQVIYRTCRKITRPYSEVPSTS